VPGWQHPVPARSWPSTKSWSDNFGNIRIEEAWKRPHRGAF